MEAVGTAFRLLRRITPMEWMVAAVVAAVLVGLVVLEPDIVEAPIENGRTIAFTTGGTLLAAVALVAMLQRNVPPPIRVVVLLAPFVVVNWWLLSPFFVDDVVDEDFATSIGDQLDHDVVANGPTTSLPPAVAEDGAAATTSTQSPAQPVLLAAGQFVGLAGHSGTGDAGLFRKLDGSLVVRFENFDIENGPDLEVYVVPGAEQTSIAAGSLHLGALKGNVGDQNYDLPTGSALAGAHTVLIWCDAFDVEFVAATLRVS